MPVYAGYTPAKCAARSNARKSRAIRARSRSASVRAETFANTQSALMKSRVEQYLLSVKCSLCHGKRLRRESLSVTSRARHRRNRATAARSAAERSSSRTPFEQPGSRQSGEEPSGKGGRHAAHRRRLLGTAPGTARLGFGYLTLVGSTPTLSPGELQRLRLATQVRSNLFGVVYVLDEPSAGLAPADTEALLRALDQLKASGNSLFVVEHEST